MQVTYKKIIEAGTCNFCKRATLNNNKLSYPYDSVYVIESEGVLGIRICVECWDKLERLINNSKKGSNWKKQ